MAEVNEALARAPQGDPPRAPELQAAMRRLRDSVRYMENDSRDGLSGYESLAADLRIVLDTLDAVLAPQGDPPEPTLRAALRRIERKCAEMRLLAPDGVQPHFWRELMGAFETQCAEALAGAALEAPPGPVTDLRGARLRPEYLASVLRQVAADNDAAATDLELHIGALEADLAAARGVLAPQGDAAPPDAIETALAKLAHAQLKLAVSARIVDVSERRWGGVAFNGDVYGVRPEDWQAVRDELNEVYDLLCGGASSSGSAPPSDKREADRREAAAFQRGVESVRGAPPNPGDQK